MHPTSRLLLVIHSLSDKVYQFLKRLEMGGFSRNDMFDPPLEAPVLDLCVSMDLHDKCPSSR